MDNVVDGDDFILRLRRRGTDNTAGTGDDMAGDFQAYGLSGFET